MGMTPEFWSLAGWSLLVFAIMGGLTLLAWVMAPYPPTPSSPEPMWQWSETVTTEYRPAELEDE